MTRYGVTTDYEYNATHKRNRLNVWSGPFYSVYEGEAYSLPSGKGYMVTTYNGDKARVPAPCPRTDDNYQAVDDAIAAALSEYEEVRGIIGTLR